MGSDEACFESISIAYTQGRVSLATTRDTLEAMCQRGRFEACQNLGIILTEEAGRKKNESFALQGYAFLERACEGHFARSCLDLGELDFHAKEGKKALAHYARACEFGDATACSKKKNLETNWKTLMCFPRFGFDWTPEGKILSIRREAPAAKAGLHVGDILESFDGVKLPAFLERQIRYEEGQKVSVVASRNGKSKNFVLRTQLLCPE